MAFKATQTYQGVFETQKSGNKTNSGKICLDIRTHASPKVGQDQVSGGVSVICWHAAPVANVLWKPYTYIRKVSQLFSVHDGDMLVGVLNIKYMFRKMLFRKET